MAMEITACPSDQAGIRLARSKYVVFTALFVGYIGYYLTRKNLTVAQVSMRELGLLTVAQIGYLSSIGTVAYALGKFVNGFIADRIGGRRTFLIGMAGSALATLAFAAAGSFPLFVAAWAVNGYFLSMGWGGLIKVMSHWFRKDEHGLAVGLMTLNFQIGSSLAKAFTALLVTMPLLVWRGLFIVPAVVLVALAGVVLLTVRERPEDDNDSHGSPLPPGPAAVPAGGGAWTVLILNPSFLLILWASGAITLVRTFFDDFTALWLSTSGTATVTAGLISSLFTLGGIGGSVLTGYLSDRWSRGNRAPYLVASMLALGILLLTSKSFPKDSVGLAAVFFFMTGFFLFGAYSIVGGVASLDFGGKLAPATAAGIIDGAGYLAASLAGVMVAQLSESAGWEKMVNVFAFLSLAVCLTLLPLLKRYPGSDPDRQTKKGT